MVTTPRALPKKKVARKLGGNGEVATYEGTSTDDRLSR